MALDRSSDMPAPDLATRWFALDVETANPKRWSVCQIGLVEMEGLHEVSARSWRVDPRGEMTLTWLHGLTAADVAGQPTFADLHASLWAQLGGQIVFCHSAFDKQAFEACTRRDSLAAPCWTWADSARAAAFIPFPDPVDGGGLKDICAALDIPLTHHDALSDARAAAAIVARALAAAECTPAELARTTRHG